MSQTKQFNDHDNKRSAKAQSTKQQHEDLKLK